MTRFPKYIRIQRQRRILSMRMKVPPQVQQFRKPLDRNVAIQAFRFAAQYRPESKVEKAARLEAIAAAKAEGKAAPASKNYSVKFGLDAVTSLVESKKAKLVLIAHDVDPIELVVWLPALCHKMNVPYAIVKSKSRLGQLVHMKTATAVAFTSVREEDKPEFARLIEAVNAPIPEP
eukprot:gnl/Ergobibamus_cyprinoides/3048.p2 GENE.gnl/Ergobibamus_cyprinoides/3048~~gnl/Ergobibamus_cyprinoides/3048.p2  ORF type:complete len:201 (+),score=102.60 gnl/Ergobibamus_cyprinoides/3048:76-603(+)